MEWNRNIKLKVPPNRNLMLQLREALHFWNGFQHVEGWHHIDLTWQQFPTGSIVRDYAVLDRLAQPDNQATSHRCALLLERVKSHIQKISASMITTLPFTQILTNPPHNPPFLPRLIRMGSKPEGMRR